MSGTHSAASEEIGRRIATVRTDAGMSARALAECADLDLTNYQRIERGRGNPTVTTLLQISVALEVDIGDLVAGLTVDDLQNGRFPYGYSDHPDRRRSRRSVDEG